jgi:hypothetical protein
MSGAGPSLRTLLSWLTERWRYRLIIVGSSSVVLNYVIG